MSEASAFRPARIGLLGGGQLACMLGEAAIAMGLRPRFFIDHPRDPAARLFADTVVCPAEGASEKDAALARFFSGLETVIFENEFVDTVWLGRVAGDACRFFPGLEAIALLQDKLGQKKLLTRVKVASAEYQVLDSGELQARPEPTLQAALAGFGGSGVLKWSRMGYDGKGVLALKDAPADLARATPFCQEALRRGIPVYLERLIPFRRELAIIGVRSRTGDFTAYPLVISEQRHGICRKVTGPACALGVNEELEKQARDSARKVAEGIGLVGCFALEFFETQAGGLLVNEIAPRVHNTGHFSQDACETSQFENHLRATLGLPLGSTRTSPAFSMLNLLGPDGANARADEMPLPVPEALTHLHWYSKAEIRPGRKVGHLNGAVASAQDLPELVSRLERAEARWATALQALSSKEKKT